MAYIAPARKARKISDRKAGRGLNIHASVHVTCERIPERLAAICEDVTALDTWMVATIYRGLIAKTVTQDAPSAFYTDTKARRDDDCYYAVAEVSASNTVCIVFAMSGHEVTIITILRPLTQGGTTFHRGSDSRRKVTPLNAGGMARKLPAHRRAG